MNLLPPPLQELHAALHLSRLSAADAVLSGRADAVSLDVAVRDCENGAYSNRSFLPVYRANPRQCRCPWNIQRTLRLVPSFYKIEKATIMRRKTQYSAAHATYLCTYLEAENPIGPRI